MNKLAVILLLIVAPMTPYGQTLEEINTQTTGFIRSLSSDQLGKINYAFEDTSRIKWTNLPLGLADRPGLRYGALSEESRRAFHRVLTSLLSSQGYLKVTSIMRLDDILNGVYDQWYADKKVPESTYKEIKSLNWNFENYYIALWGKPDAKEPWGLKLEGHHISLNLSATEGSYSMTPLFLGTDPSEVLVTKHAGLRVLSNEEDLGFKLINSLDDRQKRKATLSQEVPRDILTNPESPQRIDDYQGIKGSDLSPKQKYYLERLILEYVNNLEFDKAHAYQEKIMISDLNNVFFAWIGSYEQGFPHYYQINSPDFMIEYDNIGFQAGADHIHTIWREKGNDFGEDLLRKHYAAHPHN